MSEKLNFTHLDEYGRKRLVQVSVILFIVLALYFLAAGRVNLMWAWIYLGLGLVSIVVGGAYVLQHNPAAINERGRPPENQKSWDKIIVALSSPLYLGVYIIAGLDIRFGWSVNPPLWLHLLGAVLTVIASFLTYSAMAHNPFLSTVVQIAEQRGHRVASSGPYRYVRHPMYTSLIFSWPGIALILGSYWAVIPGLISSALMVIRTVLEDQTLKDELPGYLEYTQQTRFRLLPGIW